VGIAATYYDHMMRPHSSAGNSLDHQTLNRRAARRQQLLDAADRVIRREGPDVSMDEIALEAATAKPVLYRHFGNKGGLYQALAERYVRAVVEAIRDVLQKPGPPRDRLRGAINAYLELVENSPEIYSFLMHRAARERPEVQATVADFIRQLGAEIASGLGSELRQYGIDAAPAETWGRGIVGMVQVAGDWWLEKRPMPRERLVDELVTLLWNGFSGLEAASSEQPQEASSP
jgi:AcrR family transcriptional regulator